MLFIHRCWLRSLFGRQGVIPKFLYLVGNSIQNHCIYCRCKITVSMFGTYCTMCLTYLYLYTHAWRLHTDWYVSCVVWIATIVFDLRPAVQLPLTPTSPFSFTEESWRWGCSSLLSGCQLSDFLIRGCAVEGRVQKVAAISGVVSAPPAAATISASHSIWQ